MSLTQPIKFFGGKHYLASRIVAMFPPHLHYVEPFAGGLSVLLERDPNDQRLWLSDSSGLSGVSELVNDLDHLLVNFWLVLRDDLMFPLFARRCQAVPLSREVFDHAKGVLDCRGSGRRGELCPDIDLAWAFFVCARQSRAGQFQGFTTLTHSRTRRGVNGNVSEWLGAVDGLAAVHARLQPVVVENIDALKLIPREDTPHTLFYLDPPYLLDPPLTGVYRCEFIHDQHDALLHLLAGLKGKFLLSGYHGVLYDWFAKAHGWHCQEFDLPNNAAGGASKRRMVECVWSNFAV